MYLGFFFAFYFLLVVPKWLTLALNKFLAFCRNYNLEHSSVSPLKVKEWFVLKNVLRFFAMFTGTQKILRRLFATLPFVIIRPLRFNKDFGSPPRTQRCRISVLICALTAPKPSVFSKLNHSGINWFNYSRVSRVMLHISLLLGTNDSFVYISACSGSSCV